jgi:hypothetical protein
VAIRGQIFIRSPHALVDIPIRSLTSNPFQLLVRIQHRALAGATGNQEEIHAKNQDDSHSTPFSRLLNNINLARDAQGLDDARLKNDINYLVLSGNSAMNEINPSAGG